MGHSRDTKAIDKAKFPCNTGKIGSPKNKLPLPAPPRPFYAITYEMGIAPGPHERALHTTYCRSAPWSESLQICPLQSCAQRVPNDSSAESLLDRSSKTHDLWLMTFPRSPCIPDPPSRNIGTKFHKAATTEPELDEKQLGFSCHKILRLLVSVGLSVALHSPAGRHYAP
jgi:hypothetical protein